MQNKTARSWTFTSFAAEINIDRNAVKYAIYQREVAPDTGREHWQGYVILNNPQRMTAVKGVIGDPTAHLEIAKGNPEQNHKYCTKEESRKEGTEPVEIGQLVKLGQGKRENQSGGLVLPATL